MTIRLVTLGGLSSSVDGRELEWLVSQWLRAAVLVHLTVERAATRDALLAMFWPENDGDTAAHRLSQTVYALRQALGDDAIETRGREVRAGPRLESDALDFERAVEAGRLEDAIALYRGPFLNGVHLAPTNAFQMWVDARRALYARNFRKVCRSAIDARLGAGDLAGAVSITHAWVAPDPLDDEAQHRLIELMAKSGARVEALRHYEAYSRALEAEGLEPLDQTRELVAEIEKQTDGVTFPGGVSAPAPQPGAEVPTATAPRGEPAFPAQADAPRRRGVRWGWIVAALPAVLLAWLTATVLIPPPEPAAELAPDLPVPVAVLVFQDETEGDLDWLAHGIPRSLIEAFLKVDALRVRPFHAVWPYRDGLTPHTAIASSQQVRYLVVGGVDSTGDRLTAHAALVDGRTGDQIGAALEVEGAGLEVITKVVNEVAAKLESLLKPSLGRELRFERWRAEAGSPKAFELVQKAADLVLEKGPMVDSGNWRRAWEMLRQADAMLDAAAREDPGWAEPFIQRGWIARDIALLAFGNGVGHDSVRAALRRGLDHVARAIGSPVAGARALEIRGVLTHVSTLLPVDSVQKARLLDNASRDLIAATEENGKLARAFSSLSSIASVRGDLALAATLAERAYSEDAYLEDVQEILNRVFTFRFEAAQDGEATDWCNIIGQRFPDSWDHARCALKLMAWGGRSADPDEAWRMAERAIERTAEPYRARVEAQLHFLVAAVLAKVGAADPTQRDSAKHVVARARARARQAGLDLASPTNFVLRQEEAGVRVLLGEFAEARDLLGERYPARLETSRRFVRLF